MKLLNEVEEGNCFRERRSSKKQNPSSLSIDQSDPRNSIYNEDAKRGVSKLTENCQQDNYCLTYIYYVFHSMIFINPSSLFAKIDIYIYIDVINPILVCYLYTPYLQPDNHPPQYSSYRLEIQSSKASHILDHAHSPLYISAIQQFRGLKYNIWLVPIFSSKEASYAGGLINSPP